MEEGIQPTTLDRSAARASTLELFFDLVFVFGITQVSVVLHDAGDAASFGRGMLLLLMLWWTWTVYTWITNFTGTDGTATRLALIAASAASLVMATGVATAFGDGGVWFAGSLFVVRMLGQAGYWVGTAGNEAVRRALRSYLPLAFVAPAFFLAGGLVAEPLRTWLWVAGIAVDGASVINAVKGEWDVAAAHFAERHALFVIIALGESIVAIGVGALDAATRSFAWLASLSIAFLGAAALWWSYFDRAAQAGEDYLAAATARERGRFARDGYSLLHFPIVAGIVLFAVGAEAVVAHPDEVLLAYQRFTFAAGMALVLLAIAAATWRAVRRVPVARLVGGVALLALAAFRIDIAAFVFAIVAVAIVVGVLVAERWRSADDQHLSA